METLTTAFIIIAAVAIVVQMGILAALYAAVKKTTARTEALADQVEKRVLPTLDGIQTLVVARRPQIEMMIDNLASATNTVRSQVERLDATVNDVVDRARLQVIRADEIIGRTMDRVEETTDLVHHSVISPVRQLAGLVSGVTTALDFLLKKRTAERKNGEGTQDEMFI